MQTGGMAGEHTEAWRFWPSLILAVLLGLSAAYTGCYLWITALRFAADPIGDFFGLWSCGRFILNHPAAEVYDPAALHAAQVAMGMRPEAEYPFPYPPSFLLVLWPFGHLSYWAAFTVAIGGSFLLYLWAMLGRQWRPIPLAWAVLAPTTVLAVISGQIGFLATALLAGGFRLSEKRPLLGGILFGLLTYKPQLGILVPVALVAARMWSSIAAAAASFAILVAATCLAFGPAIWVSWLNNIIGYSQQFAAESSEIVHLMPSVLPSFEMLGAPAELAWAAQALAAGFAAAVVWFSFRGGPTPLAAATLFAATFLATPHAFVYDMPVLATALLWTVLDEQRRGPAFTPAEIAILLSTAIAPIILPAGEIRLPVVVIALVLFAAMTTRRCRRPTAPVVSCRAAESP